MLFSKKIVPSSKLLMKKSLFYLLNLLNVSYNSPENYRLIRFINHKKMSFVSVIFLFLLHSHK